MMDNLNKVLDNLMKVGIGDTAEAKIILQAVIDDKKTKIKNIEDFMKTKITDNTREAMQCVIRYHNKEIKELQAAMGRLS